MGLFVNVRYELEFMCKCALSVQHHRVLIQHGTSPLHPVWVAIFTHVQPPSTSSCTTAVSPPRQVSSGLWMRESYASLKERITLSQTEPTPTTRGARKEINTPPISAVPISAALSWSKVGPLYGGTSQIPLSDREEGRAVTKMTWEHLNFPRGL